MLGLVLYTLTILAIGTQTRLEDHLRGNTGCLVHTITNILLHGWIVVGGTGMAWFRLVCLRSITMSDKKKTYIFNRILVSQLLAYLIMSVPVFWRLNANNLWEVVGSFRFCKDMATEQADILMIFRQDKSILHSTAYNVLLEKIAMVIVSQGLAVFEFAIYAKIIYDLWLHDREFFEGGIITQDMRQERNRKNIINLKGQIACFLVETSRILFLVIGPIFNFVDFTSLTVIVPIITNSLVAFTQLWASHEVKRFIKEKIE